MDFTWHPAANLFHVVDDELIQELANDIRDNGQQSGAWKYAPEEHARVIQQRSIPDKHFWQIVGHLVVTGRKWCDFLSFDPRISGPQRLVVVRHNRCSESIARLMDRLEEAEVIVDEIVAATKL